LGILIQLTIVTDIHLYYAYMISIMAVAYPVFMLSVDAMLKTFNTQDTRWVCTTITAIFNKSCW